MLKIYCVSKRLLNNIKSMHVDSDVSKWVSWLFNDDDLVLCGELEESLSRLVWGFGRVCKKWSLKVNLVKSKVMVQSEENLQC